MSGAVGWPGLRLCEGPDSGSATIATVRLESVAILSSVYDRSAKYHAISGTSRLGSSLKLSDSSDDKSRTGMSQTPRLGFIHPCVGSSWFLKDDVMMRFVLGLAILCFVGCTSITTNMWTRSEDDNLHPDPCQNLKGIPVMLKVPSHLEVTITETLYAAHDTERDELTVVDLKQRDLEAVSTLKYTEKMFLVDPVKVAAGSGAYDFGFAKTEKGSEIKGGDDSAAGHGYLHSIGYSATDTTITTSASLIANILGGKSPATAKAEGAAATLAQDFGLVSFERVVAFRRFDLATPGYEQEVRMFLDANMNCCHDPSSNVIEVRSDVSVPTAAAAVETPAADAPAAV